MRIYVKDIDGNVLGYYDAEGILDVEACMRRDFDEATDIIETAMELDINEENCAGDVWKAGLIDAIQNLGLGVRLEKNNTITINNFKDALLSLENWSEVEYWLQNLEGAQ